MNRPISSRARMIALTLVVGCGGVVREAAAQSVVVYSALDREFAEPVLKAYGQQHGVRVLPKFDVESTKTVGLTNLIVVEAARPRCDLFWNNEILNTLRLKERGLLAPFHPSHARDLPETFKAKDGTWYGFAARARILIVNTKLVAEADRPKGIKDLLDPKWKGKIGIAKPLFGTTATHAACLFAAWGDDKAKAFFRDLKANGVHVLSGNKQVALAAGSGEIAIGLTDTDDAMGEIDAGSPVSIIYPDRAAGRLGHAVHSQHAGDHQGVTPSERSRGPGRLPAEPRGRGCTRPRPECADPALEEHQGRSPGRNTEDRARDGRRLRGGGEALGQGRHLPRL